ncbi:MAG: hypothetical protein ACYDCQ_10695 [Dehalococcoidia bacterium]
MEQDFGLDLEEVGRVIDTADVIIVRFKILESRLLIDARHSDVDPPLVKLVPKASSVEDRFRSLKQLRPRFPLPDRIMSFEWPKHVSMLEDVGIWQRLEARLRGGGGDRAAEAARAIYNELVNAERKEEVAAIRGGDGYQTLWEKPKG